MARNVKNRSDKRTKLAIFTGSDIRRFGGGEKYVIELSNRLKNFDITIFDEEITPKLEKMLNS